MIPKVFSLVDCNPIYYPNPNLRIELQGFFNDYQTQERECYLSTEDVNNPIAYCKSYTSNIGNIVVILNSDSVGVTPSNFRIKNYLGQDMATVYSFQSNSIVFNSFNLNNMNSLYLYYIDNNAEKCLAKISVLLDSVVEYSNINVYYRNERVFFEISSQDQAGLKSIKIEYEQTRTTLSLEKQEEKYIASYQLPLIADFEGYKELTITSVIDGIGNELVVDKKYYFFIDTKPPEVEGVYVTLFGNEKIELEEGDYTVPLTVSFLIEDASDARYSVNVTFMDKVYSKSCTKSDCTFTIPYNVSQKTKGLSTETIRYVVQDSYGNRPVADTVNFVVNIVEFNVSIKEIILKDNSQCGKFLKSRDLIMLSNLCNLNQFLNFYIGFENPILKLKEFSTLDMVVSLSPFSNDFIINYEKDRSLSENFANLVVIHPERGVTREIKLNAISAGVSENSPIYQDNFIGVSGVKFKKNFRYGNRDLSFEELRENLEPIFVWKDMIIEFEIRASGRCFEFSTVSFNAGVFEEGSSQKELQKISGSFDEPNYVLKGSFNFTRSLGPGQYDLKLILNGSCGRQEITVSKIQVLPFYEYYLEDVNIKNVSLYYKYNDQLIPIESISFPNVDKWFDVEYIIEFSSKNPPVIFNVSIHNQDENSWNSKQVSCSGFCNDEKVNFEGKFNPKNLSSTNPIIKVIGYATDKFGKKILFERSFFVNLSLKYYVENIKSLANQEHPCGRYWFLKNSDSTFGIGNGIIFKNEECEIPDWFEFKGVLRDLSILGLNLKIEKYLTNGSEYVSQDNIVKIKVIDLSSTDLTLNKAEVSIVDDVGTSMRHFIYLLDSKVNRTGVYDKGYFAINGITYSLFYEGSEWETYNITKLEDLEELITVWQNMTVKFLINATGRCLFYSNVSIDISPLLSQEFPLQSLNHQPSSSFKDGFVQYYRELRVTKNVNEDVVLKLYIDGACGKHELIIGKFRIKQLSDSLPSDIIELLEEKPIPEFYSTIDPIIIAENTEYLDRGSVSILFKLKSKSDYPNLKVSKIIVHECNLVEVYKNEEGQIVRGDKHNDISIEKVELFRNKMPFTNSVATNLLYFNLKSVSRRSSQIKDFSIHCNLSLYLEDDIRFYAIPFSLTVLSPTSTDYFKVLYGYDYKQSLFKLIEKTWYDLKNGTETVPWWAKIFAVLYGINAVFTSIFELSLHFIQSCYILRISSKILEALGIKFLSGPFEYLANILDTIAKGYLWFHRSFYVWVGSIFSVLFEPQGIGYGYAKLNWVLSDFENYMISDPLIKSFSYDSNAIRKNFTVLFMPELYIDIFNFTTDKQYSLQKLSRQIDHIVNDFLNSIVKNIPVPGAKNFGLELGQRIVKPYISIFFDLFLDPFNNVYSANTFYSLPALAAMEYKKLEARCDYLKCLVNAYKYDFDVTVCEDVKTANILRYEGEQISWFNLRGLLFTAFSMFLPYNLEDSAYYDDLILSAALFGYSYIDSSYSNLREVLFSTVNTQDEISREIYKTYFSDIVVEENGKFYLVLENKDKVELNFVTFLTEAAIYYGLQAGTETLNQFVTEFFKNQNWIKNNNDKCNLLNYLLGQLISDGINYVLFGNIGRTIAGSGSSFDMKLEFKTDIGNFFINCLSQNFKINLTEKTIQFFDKEIRCGPEGWNLYAFEKFYSYYFLGYSFNGTENSQKLPNESLRAIAVGTTNLANNLFSLVLKSIGGLGKAFGSENSNSVCDFSQSWLGDLLKLALVDPSQPSAKRAIKRLDHLCSLIQIWSNDPSARKTWEDLMKTMGYGDLDCSAFSRKSCEPINTCETFENFKKNVLDNPRSFSYSCEGEVK
ncbi:MAG: hypothetical protein QW524_01905 [Candidatus Woesearchaeota archaeon]